MEAGELLEQSLQITRRMLSHCRESSWESLPTLARERHALLVQAFAAAPAPDRAGHFLEVITQLQALDEQILQYCEAQKASCGDELDRLSRGRQATDAYLRESG